MCVAPPGVSVGRNEARIAPDSCAGMVRVAFAGELLPPFFVG